MAGEAALPVTPANFNMALNERVKYLKSVLKKQTPKVTQADIEGGKRMLEKVKGFEESKDQSIKTELTGLAKDVGNFVYNATHGVGKLFYGFGEGKRHICSVCLETAIFNTRDSQWYCSDHRWFGNLTTEQQEKERACLYSKVG